MIHKLLFIADMDRAPNYTVSILAECDNHKIAHGASGLTVTAQGGEGVGEEEPRSDASSQVESEVSEPPPFFNFFKIYKVLICIVFFVAYFHLY
jgi:hypothetical protein